MAPSEPALGYLARVGLLLLGVVVLAYLLFALGQLGRQSPPPAVQSTATAATQAQPAAAAPVLAPSPRAGGAVRMTGRVLEPSYTVLPGDTLASIAAKFGTSVDALHSINNLADRNVLRVGQKLVIPNQP